MECEQFCWILHWFSTKVTRKSFLGRTSSHTSWLSLIHEMNEIYGQRCSMNTSFEPLLCLKENGEVLITSCDTGARGPIEALHFTMLSACSTSTRKILYIFHIAPKTNLILEVFQTSSLKAVLMLFRQSCRNCRSSSLSKVTKKVDRRKQIFPRYAKKSQT